MKGQNCLEDLKTWGNCNIGLEGIRLDNCQWKECVFIVVLASMNLTEYHRMAIPRDPMCGLHIVRKEHSHQAIYKFIEKADAGIPSKSITYVTIAQYFVYLN